MVPPVTPTIAPLLWVHWGIGRALPAHRTLRSSSPSRIPPATMYDTETASLAFRTACHPLRLKSNDVTAPPAGSTVTDVPSPVT